MGVRALGDGQNVLSSHTGTVIWNEEIATGET